MKRIISLLVIIISSMVLTGCKWHNKNDMSKHIYTNNVIKAPTDEEDGLIEHYCEICEYKWEEKIPSFNHKHSPTTTEVPSTCLESKYYHEVCDCGLSSKLYSSIDGHKYGEYRVNKKPTKNEDGLMTTKCLTCNEKYEVVLSKLDKNYTENLEYEFDDETKSYTVVGVKEGERLSKELVIPSFYNNYPVTKIGEKAFYYCDAKIIDLPNSIVILDKLSFSKGWMEEIVIPDSVTVIKSAAFSDCPNLKSIVLSKNLLIIEGSAFDYCSDLTSIVIPDKVVFIGREAFEMCASLKSINIPKSVKYVGGFAFDWCMSLSKIELESAKTVLDYRAFRGHTGMQEIYFSGSIYDWCSNSFGVDVFSESVTMFMKNSKGEWEELIDLVIPESVTTITYSAFANFRRIKTVKLPNSLTTIKASAFKNCIELEEIIIPDSVIYIDPYVFKGCIKLEKVLIPDNVLYIGYDAFLESNTNLNILCEAESKPQYWLENWNRSGNGKYNVQWGYNK